MTNADGSVIAGGGYNTIGTNALWASISGGLLNNIYEFSDYAWIGGGGGNEIEANACYGVIGGGWANKIEENLVAATIGGGWTNFIDSNSSHAVIGGGRENRIGTNAEACVIAGWAYNIILSNSVECAILGGSENETGGYRSVAGGFRAKARHHGTFVWGDTSVNADVASSADYQFTARATGGFRLITAVDGSGNTTAGVTLTNGATYWGTLSDRAAKKNFQAVDCKEIVEKLAKVPVQHWNYKFENDSSIPHLGPVAQDFKGAFYPGRDDKVITTLEFDGAELAAIQGLHQMLVEKDQEISTLRTQLAAHTEFHRSVEVRFADLENAMQGLKTSTPSVVGSVEAR